ALGVLRHAARSRKGILQGAEGVKGGGAGGGRKPHGGVFFFGAGGGGEKPPLPGGRLAKSVTTPRHNGGVFVFIC
ncbi:hypothetical protein C5964_21195, partial [Cronobacter sakazakii]